MKKNMKMFVMGLLVGALVFSSLAVSFAQRHTEDLKAYFDNIKVYVNGEQIDYTASNGAYAEPFIIDGTTYIPLRVFMEGLDKQVKWDKETKSIYVNDVAAGPAADPQTGGTDPAADPGTQAPATGDIGVEKAKAIAMEHAGVSSGEVTFLKAQKDRDDGRIVYEVEFYKGTTEYDYDIDAATGQILSYDRDIENFTRKNSGAGTSTAPAVTEQPAAGGASAAVSADIGLDKAKSIALNKAGVSENQVTYKKARQDYDDGRKVYDIEFYVGTTEYELEIDASTGKILDYSVDSIYD